MTSDLNPEAHETLANLVIVQVSDGGNFEIYNAVGTTDAVIDVQGWFAP